MNLRLLLLPLLFLSISAVGLTPTQLLLATSPAFDPGKNITRAITNKHGFARTADHGSITTTSRGDGADFSAFGRQPTIGPASAVLIAYYNFEGSVTSFFPVNATSHTPALFDGSDPAHSSTLIATNLSMLVVQPGLPQNLFPGDPLPNLTGLGLSRSFTQTGTGTLDLPLSASGFQDMTLSFAINAQGNGYLTARGLYSTNGGGGFTEFASSPLPNSGTIVVGPWSVPAAANNAQNLVLRIELSQGQSTGLNLQNVIDNIQVNGTTIPQMAPAISIQDAQVFETTAGSVNMIFPVTLNAPAPSGGASVSFTTQQEAPALNHATAGKDYTTTSGTVNFAAGEQFKTISVPILADDQPAEANETFLVNLSNPVNCTITDGTATGTILITNQPGAILISELRTSGPGGAGDDFVEIYNNSDSPQTVNDGSGINDAAHGYGLFKMGAECSASPVLIGVIPNATVIPARGHYLFVGSAYSLADYGGTGAATGDQVLTQDIESDRNVAIFSTASLVGVSTTNRLDAVGFGSNTGGICDLFNEGTTLTPLTGSVLEYSYFRDECGKKGNPTTFGPCPTGGLLADSNVNNNDFIFADATGSATPAGQRLGAPGPQNLGSPRLNLFIPAVFVDSTISSNLPPNRERNTTPVTNGASGTLTVRRRFVNNTGANVTRLRFRIVDFSSLLVPAGIADLRALTSTTITISGINDSATCAATGTPSTAPCSVTVFGTTVEQPPNQSLGGALNSSMNAGTITLPTPLAPGQSINLQFLLGVQQTGGFKFFFNIEALPGALGAAPVKAPPTKTLKFKIR